MEKHQANYHRIQALRAATASFDAQIKDTLRLLANTRKELVSTSATVFPADAPSFDIDYDELLSYARRISKTTVPPAAALALAAAPAAAPDAKAESNGGLGAETAAATPAAGTPNGANGAQMQQQDGTWQAHPQTQPSAVGIGITPTNGSAGATQLPEDLAWRLNASAAGSFAPWPSEEQVRKGALASLAFLADQGIDAENFDPDEEKARQAREEEARRAQEETERKEREDRESRYREEQAQRASRERENREREQAEALRRGSVAVGGSGGGLGLASPVVEKQGQFKFMDDDDDDSE